MKKSSLICNRSLIQKFVTVYHSIIVYPLSSFLQSKFISFFSINLYPHLSIMYVNRIPTFLDRLIDKKN